MNVRTLDDIPILMDVHQLAELLGLNEGALRNAAAKGTIPADKIGNKWIFSKEVLFPNILSSHESAHDVCLFTLCPIQTFYDSLSPSGKERMDEYVKFLEYLESQSEHDSWLD